MEHENCDYLATFENNNVVHAEAVFHTLYS